MVADGAELEAALGEPPSLHDAGSPHDLGEGVGVAAHQVLDVDEPGRLEVGHRFGRVAPPQTLQQARQKHMDKSEKGRGRINSKISGSQQDYLVGKSGSPQIFVVVI